MIYSIGLGIRNGTGGLDNICIFTSTYEIFEFGTVKEKFVCVEWHGKGKVHLFGSCSNSNSWFA